MAAAGIAAVVGVLVLLHRSGSRSALDQYKAELKAKGEKLTFAELGLSPSTNEQEIACRDALNACSNWFVSAGAPGTIPQLMEYVSPGKARITWRGQLHGDTFGIGAVVSWEALERDSQAAVTNLAPVILALRHPAPDTGWVCDSTSKKAIIWPPRTFVRDRSVARSLVLADTVELRHGNLEAAQTDLRAIIAMTQVERNELTLVHQMIRVAIGQLALGATWESLQAPGWDEPHLAALQGDWEQVNFEDALERGFSGERAAQQLLMAWIRRSNSKDVSQILSSSSGSKAPKSTRELFAEFTRNLPWMWYRFTGAANDDELFQLKCSQEALTLARDLKTNRPGPEVNFAATNIITEINNAIRKDRLHRLLVSAMAIPNFSRAFQTAARAETQRRLAISAIAVKRYELKYGKAPSSLNALVPEFLSAVPIDPMSGKALCYRLKSDGTQVLYSVGEDGKDDGGDATPTFAKGKPGLWEGRDAVWPTATSDEEMAKVEAEDRKKQR
jgi:hypothetical protein